MARVRGPLNSQWASGSVGDTVFSPRRGVFVVRVRAIPANPRSDTQVANRTKLAVVAQIIRRTKVTNLTITGEMMDIEAHYRDRVTTGQVWNSIFSRRILGVGNANYDADITAYDALAMGVKDLWEAQATIAGLTSITRGTVTVAGGAQAYMIQRAAAVDGYGTFDADVPQAFTVS